MKKVWKKSHIAEKTQTGDPLTQGFANKIFSPNQTSNRQPSAWEARMATGIQITGFKNSTGV